MKFTKSLLAVATLATAFSANAVVTGGLRGGPAGSFATLSTTSVNNACLGGVTCALSGAITASITGGTVYNLTAAFTDQPAGTFCAAISVRCGARL